MRTALIAAALLLFNIVLVLGPMVEGSLSLILLLYGTIISAALMSPFAQDYQPGLSMGPRMCDTTLSPHDR